MARPTGKPQRQYEFDWLRVLVILNLVPYHVAWLMIYVPGFSHIPQEGREISIVKYYIAFVAYWHMPLLFFTAGVTAYISLNYRSSTEYMKERVKRLLVPLVFFMFTLYPMMLYFLPGATHDRSLSDYLLRFWAQCLKAPHSSWPPGSRPELARWGHLWFVGYLFLISIVTLPLLLYYKKHVLRGSTDKFIALAATGYGIFLPGALFAVILATLAPIWPLFYRHNLYQDWTFFFYNLAAFVLGFSLSPNQRFQQTVERHLRLSLPLAMVSSIVILVLRFRMPTFSTPAYSLRYLFYSTIFGFQTWLWILALLGLARRFLTQPNKFLMYFNQASYPFYILHLTLMIPIGHYVVQWPLGIAAEFVVISVLTFTATLAGYELLVKRTRVTRFLFGSKA